MRARLLGFIAALRDAGIACSVSETLDATRAAATVGIDQPVLREALAATLVKDQSDRPTFDVVFDRYFGVRRRTSVKGKPAADEGADGSGGQGMGRGRIAKPDGSRGEDPKREENERGADSKNARQIAARRALMAKPFEAMDAREVDELRELLHELSRRFRSRWSRRMQRANLGRVDMRRTIRRATSRGGVPVELIYRKPRPGKTNLVALVDLSHSAATATNFLLALLVPAHRFFRRVLLIGYVDTPVEIFYEHGHVIPGAALDLAARSDFGRVLLTMSRRYQAMMNRNTVLLILGDARNNRRPPRADLLARLQQQVRETIWLNPEQRLRWDTGDSVMSTYARHCGSVINAWNLRTLIAALDRISSVR